MSKAKGKTPSLIGSSLGRPVAATAGKKCACSRCDAVLVKGDRCIDVPQPNKPFNSSRRFCVDCFAQVLARTKADVTALEAL
jgi:uncharacterized 2Fe-2S/4Fe-4S cluster protein (DUF4445 family)